MKTFYKESDMIEYGENLRKGEFEHVLFNDTKIILNCTDKTYDDYVSGIAEDSLKQLANFFKIDGIVEIDFISKVRDAILDNFQENYNVRIINAIHEY